MAKRTSRQVKQDILKVLKDGNEHTYGDIERKANTNWLTVRDHCEELEFFDSVTISSQNRVKITKRGIDLLSKIKE